MITLQNFRIHDPKRPSLLNDNWLRFDAESVVLDINFETDDQPPYHAIAYIETRRLVTAPYQIVATSNPTDIQTTAASFGFAQMPTFNRQERPHGQQAAWGFGGGTPFRYRYRFRIDIQNQRGSIGEIIIPFAVDFLPVAVDFIHVYDPAAPTPIPSKPGQQRVPNKLSALGIRLKFFTELTEVDCTIAIKDRGALDALITSKTKKFTPNGEIDHVFLWDPVPKEIKPPLMGASDQYLIEVNFQVSSYKVAALASFGLEYKPPVGTIAITQAIIHNRPVFDSADGPGVIDDTSERVICSVKVEARGYDPASEDGRCAVNVDVYGSTNFSSMDFFQDFTFDADNKAWVFLELPNPPALSTEQTKRVTFSAYHGARKSLVETTVPYQSAFRPERTPEVVGFKWNTPDSLSPSRVWLQGTPSVVLDVLTYHHPDLSPIAIAIAMLPRSRTDWRLTPDGTRVVNFSTIQTKAPAGPTVNRITIDLPPFPNDIFEFDHVSVYVAFQYSFQEVSYSGAVEIREEELPAGGALRFSSSGSWGSAHPTPTPSFPPQRLSGAHWCAQFPTSTNLDSLAEPFRSNLRRFIAMIESNGGNARVNATRRPRERAYLMHYSFRIARMGTNPGRVPAQSGLDIIWNHPRAVEAAEQMVQGYGIVYEPALNSLHTLGQAVDMVVRGLPARIRVMTAGGEQSFDIGNRPAEQNVALWRIADQHFSIKKSPSDWVHWSQK
jgi:hypothetical protein